MVYVILLASAVAGAGRGLRGPAACGGRHRAVDGAAVQPIPVANPRTPQRLPTSDQGLEVQFDNVQFSYPSRPDQPALQNFSLHLAPGETVALVGTSGAENHGVSVAAALLRRGWRRADRQDKRYRRDASC